MDVSLQDEIIKKFSELFTDSKGNLNNLYISIMDGWSLLLIDCLKELQNHIIHSDTQLLKEFCILDIKESYGKLVIYTSVSDDIINEIIDKYILKSTQVCELTGDTGFLCYKNGFYKTLSPSSAERMGFKLK